MSWLASALELIRDLIRVFVPSADEKEKRISIRAKQAFIDFVKRNQKAVDERNKPDQ